MSTVLDEILLYSLSKHNEDESREYTTPRKVIKYALVVFIVLTSCGLLAFGLSSLFFSFYDVPDILERHTFLSTNEVDGLEIIWTVPFAELKDRKNLVSFLKDLREELTKLQHEKRLSDPYLVSMMTPQIIWKQSEGYDLEGIVKYADFLNVISYEFYGPWDIEEGAFTGPVGPLYGGRRGNIDDTMKIHTCETKKPSQLTLGIPLFGKFWKNVKREKINQTETMCVKEVCRIEGQEDISDIWRVSEFKNGKPVGGLISWNDREDEEVGIPWEQN
ncbi:hypothetical protein CAEBREN_29035 [Caenorhabditis brenneri]|uniref:GH18 domain-containing protein n=1 Tax=Caenorhabditis brenneri TaxID=135651 RepID=G0NAI7_CAEBE|nr:hypothetical protein CAEBREN_29035 [Caenorhabditis brenneri]